MLNKAAIVFLIFNILYFSFGYFYIFKSIQKSIKREIKSIIYKDSEKLSLEVFHFNKDIYTKTAENFKWHDNNKEFYYFGKLYDIVKTEFKDNEVIIHALNDKQEQLLVSNFNSYINTYTGTQLPNKIKIQNLISNLQFTYIKNANAIEFHNIQSSLEYFEIANLYEFIDLYNSHHPPKA